MRVTNGWSCRLRPTPGQVVARPPRRRARNSSAEPMPVSMQQLRRADRARGQDHLALRSNDARARALVRIARQSRGRRDIESEDCAPVTTSRFGRFERRAQEGVGGAPAAAVALGDLEHRRAVLLGPVVVVRSAGCRSPRSPRGTSRSSGRGERCSATLQRPARTVELRRAALVVLRAAGSRAARPASPSRSRPAPPRGRSRAAGRARRASRSSSSSRRGSCRAGCRATGRRRAARARWSSPSRASCGTGWRTPPGS